MVEGRNAAKETSARTPPRTGSRTKVASMGLEGVRIAATKDKELRFAGTATPHHTNATGRASMRYHDAAAGVDAVTWQDYEEGLSTRVHALHQEIHGSYGRHHHGRSTYPRPMESKDRWA
jgi:hypothetical protein